MNKDFLQKVILIPAVTGMALCAVFCFFTNIGADNLVPINKNTVLAYHDQKTDEAAEINDDVAPPEWERLKDDQLIGTVNEIPLRYNAGYSTLLSGASLAQGSSAFGEIGCSYIKIINSNAEAFGDIINIKSYYGNCSYKYSYSFTAESEYKVLIAAPDVKNSVIVYYRISDGIGITSGYNAMVYEEVA